MTAALKKLYDGELSEGKEWQIVAYPVNSWINHRQQAVMVATDDIDINITLGNISTRINVRNDALTRLRSIGNAVKKLQPPLSSELSELWLSQSLVASI
jgi:hypothetical protein